MPAPGGLWHRWLVLLAEWQRPSHWRSTDLAKSPPDRIVNPVTFRMDLFGFSSFRSRSLFQFFCNLGHACTSTVSSYPLDNENRQRIPGSSLLLTHVSAEWEGTLRRPPEPAGRREQERRCGGTRFLKEAGFPRTPSGKNFHMAGGKSIGRCYPGLSISRRIFVPHLVTRPLRQKL